MPRHRGTSDSETEGGEVLDGEHYRSSEDDGDDDVTEGEEEEDEEEDTEEAFGPSQFLAMGDGVDRLGLRRARRRLRVDPEGDGGKVALEDGNDHSGIAVIDRFGLLLVCCSWGECQSWQYMRVPVACRVCGV